MILDFGIFSVYGYGARPTTRVVMILNEINFCQLLKLVQFEKGYGQDILCNIYTDVKYIILNYENGFKISTYSATFSEKLHLWIGQNYKKVKQ